MKPTLKQILELDNKRNKRYKKLLQELETLRQYHRAIEEELEQKVERAWELYMSTDTKMKG